MTEPSFQHQPFQDEDPKLNATAQEMNEYNRYDPQSPTRNTKRANCVGKCTKWTLYLLPLIFFLVSFIILIAILSMRVADKSDYVDSAIRVMNTFSDNLKKSPIKTIEVIDEAQSCPAGSIKKLLFSWAGVKSGCFCSGTAYSSACWARSSCNEVNQVDKKDTFLWKGKAFCLTTFQNPVFLAPSSDCPAETWEATSYLCLQNTETTKPISKLSISSIAANAVAPTDIQYIYLEALPTDRRVAIQTLVVDRTGGLNPIVDLEVELSNPPCLDKKNIPNTISQSVYPLLNGISGCGSFGDGRDYHDLLDSTTEVQFETDNGLKTIFDSVFKYNDYLNSNDKYNFYSEHRVSVGSEDKCYTIDTTKLTIINESSKDLLDDIIAGAVISLIFAIFGLILSFFYVCCRGCRIGKKYICNSRILHIILFILGFIMCIIFFCLAGYYYKKNTDINDDVFAEDYIGELLRAECFKSGGFISAAQTVHDFLDSSITTVGPLIVFLLFWALIFIVTFIICWILRSLWKKLPFLDL